MEDGEAGKRCPLSLFTEGLTRPAVVFDVGAEHIVMNKPCPPLNLLLADLLIGRRMRFGHDTSCAGLFCTAG